MVDYRFTLELTDFTVQKRITVTQGEVAARKFIINFSENGKPYQLNPYSRVVFRMRTPSGKDIFNHCIVNGNTVEYILTADSIAENGLCEARVEVYGNDLTGVLYTPKLELYIAENSFDDSSIEGSNEFTALQSALSDVSELMEDLRGLIAETKEIYKIENIGLGGLGGNETERLFSIHSELNVEPKATEKYLFSIPRPLEDADAMELQTDVADISLSYDGDRYTGLFIPKTDVSALVLEYLIVYGVSDYSGPIDLHIEHLYPMAKKVGDIETALDNIIDIQNNLIGGEG